MNPRPRLGDYFENRQESGREGLPTLSVTMNDGIVHRNELERRTETTLQPEEHLLVRRGDIAYNMMRMWQGACGLADTDGLVSPAYVVLAPKKNIDSRFAYHWFKSDRMVYLFWAYSHGLTEDRLRLYFDDLAEIPIAPPSIEQQRRIVSVLDAWDRAIDQTERLIAAKELQFSALLNQTFSSARDLTEPPPRGWDRKSIGSLAKVVGGGTPDTADASLWGDGIFWCTPTDIASAKTRYLKSTARTISPEGLRSSSATLLPIGSVALCSRASVGICAIVAAPMCTNQGFQSLVPKPGTDSNFLYYLVRSCERRFIRNAAGSTFLEITAGEVSKLLVAAPTTSEQRRIGQQLAAFNDQIDLLRERLGVLRTQKRGLLQRFVIGEWQLDERFDPAPAQQAILAGASA